MDNISNTNLNNKEYLKDVAVSSPISCFEKDKNFVFLYKKSEKMVTAIYAVTNFFADSEPLKRTLREMSTDLLRSVSLLKDFVGGGESLPARKVQSVVLEIVSLLEVATKAGMVSEMNSQILSKEFNVLLGAIKERALLGGDKVVFPNEFFTVQKDTALLSDKTNVRGDENVSKTEVIYKGQDNYVAPIHKGHMALPISREVKAPATTGAGVGVVEVKKNARQNSILAIIKKKHDVTIKDISAIIREYSEKTIQRELLDLVSQGVLKKVGERRWSKYSMNS